VYKPLIDEDLAIHQSVNNLFDNLCCMRKGQAIKDLVQNSEISQSDISSIVEALNAKAKTAPEEVECNCLEANLS
jgi:Penicillinase repressor.